MSCSLIHQKLHSIILDLYNATHGQVLGETLNFNQKISIYFNLPINSVTINALEQEHHALPTHDNCLVKSNISHTKKEVNK